MLAKMKKIVVLCMTVVMLLTVVACGAPAEPAADAKPTLDISHHPYIHALPTVYAEENGMYDEFDYTVTQYSGGPTQNEAISTNAWEVGTSGMGGAVFGVSGYNLKIIGFGVSDAPTTDLWVRADSPIAQVGPDENGIYGSAETWKDVTILCPSGTTQQMALIATLDHFGVSISDVNVIDTSFAQCFTAFGAGEADVTVLGSPYSIQAIDEGWVKVSSAEMLGLEVPTLIVATEQAVQEKPEVVEAWLSEFLTASDKLNEDIDASAEMLYEFQRGEGIMSEVEDQIKDLTIRSFPGLEENTEWFKIGEDGKTHAEDVVLQFVDFLISQEKMTEEDKTRMIESNFIDSSFIENLAAN